MKMKDDEAAREREFLNRFWTFRKEYYHAESDDAWWGKLIDEVDVLHQTYNNLFLDGLLLVCVDDIERRQMQESGSGVRYKKYLDTLYKRLTAAEGVTHGGTTN